MSDRHQPVLLDETVDLLQIRPNNDAIDATVGDGGHAASLLQRSAPHGRLLALDRDQASLERARCFLAPFGERVTFARLTASRLAEALARIAPPLRVRAVFLDLGVATHHLAEASRGFSFQLDGPLDMRFDPAGGGPTAADLLNRERTEELIALFRQYGEERLAAPIAAAIVARRRVQPFARTQDLVEVVLDAYRQKLRSRTVVPWVGGRHPATKVFQALRIAVNDELGELAQALAAAVACLERGGRVAVISFHSLEDRIVKRFLRANASVAIVTKKPITPSREEQNRHPACRSAKLRVAEKKA